MRRTILPLTLLAMMTPGACGGASPSPGSSTSGTLTVLAAASLKTVLPEIGSAFTMDHPEVRFAFSFGGTDQITAQIEQGAPADVFAGASTRYGDQLAEEGLIAPYRAFCTNQLVLVMPSSNPAGITSPQDLASKPVKLVIGSSTLPVGSYSRTVLSNLDTIYGPGYAESVLAKVVSTEDSVTSILAKVQSGEADAGFVYVTDALAAGSRVRYVRLPNQAQAVATYPIAVVRASSLADAGQQFVAFVLSEPGQMFLRRAGFGPPPAS